MNSDSNLNPDEGKNPVKFRNRTAAILDDKTSKYFVKLFIFMLLYKLWQYTFNLFEKIDLFSGVFDGLYFAFSSFITGISVKFIRCSMQKYLPMQNSALP